MTDTLPDIEVRGQRRREPAEPFPERPEPVVFEGQHAELDPNIGQELDPCADPATALDWNADAAAAEAKREFERRAADMGDDGLYTREWHAYVYQNASGHMYLGPVSYGPPMGGMVTPNTSGMTPDNLIGSVHNHPGGSMNPSGSDWQGFDGLHSWVSAYAGTARADQMRLYIIARDVNDPNSQMSIHVFDKDSNRNSDSPAEDVNPDGQPCP
ncbi:MAG: hypothetical protein Q8R45_03620 [Brevundimonas sp.]|uniref:hypothetical protein n=1 Tax=Brevundimonas sp. TaxID=1871086 RepID=UPI00271DD3DC|nr:hypothetical protein [Brevundimonas sp.]MDO9588534.1 hypothetical protein [Brevundimonas sp.]MDP3656039.1 hypothetical protein [Brevundimonas sp.]MDZ4110174.1 hypothetical protein [Brevundimonas sp.]MDZ4322148.1 hypothetical protein [Phenylobacterium sp.]